MRTKRVKVIQSKRSHQFEMARKQLARAPLDFYILAAFNATPSIPAKDAIDDFARHQLALGRGKFTLAPYVHAFIDATLGLEPKPPKERPARRRRKQRYVQRRRDAFRNDLHP